MNRSDAPEDLRSYRDPVGERLLRARTIIIAGEITQRLAERVTGQLLAMAADSDDTITIYINSQGGHVEAGDTIHDMIRFVRPRVRVVGTGWVASAGALIFVAVPREQRFCLPNTRFLLHQPAGGAGGTASDIEIEAREILRMRDRLNHIFARETGQPLERIEEDTHRNFWLDAEAAVKYGLVGKVVERFDELGGEPVPGPIDPRVDIGHVHLKVADLERALGFWCGVLGFELTQRYGHGGAFVSAGGYHHHIGLNTWHSRGGSPPPDNATGLYHVAIRYPDRRTLADALRRLMDAGIPIDGASDHGVSEALYLRDPDGNGVELYRDRPREQWPVDAEGRLEMFTRPLDVEALLAEAG